MHYPAAWLLLGVLVACQTRPSGSSPLLGDPASIAVRSSCPEATLAETEVDCPWAGIARDLQQAAASGQDLGLVLEAEAPGIAANLQDGRSYPAWLDLWGTAINFDQGAQGIIVDSAIVDLCNQRMGVAPRFEAVTAPNVTRSVTHAGVQHTYSYLFSNLITPFGYKRARWVQGDVNDGFALPKGLLGPTPSSGSLFMNATYFAGSIAFVDDPAERAVLDAVVVRHPEAVAEAIRTFDFMALKVRRLTETVQVPGSTRTVVLRTDLVEFTRPVTTANVAWLVYSIHDDADHRSRLISAFPVGPSAVGQILAPDRLGSDQLITTVYNAYVSGVTGSKLKGVRALR